MLARVLGFEAGVRYQISLHQCVSHRCRMASPPNSSGHRNVKMPNAKSGGTGNAIQSSVAGLEGSRGKTSAGGKFEHPSSHLNASGRKGSYGGIQCSSSALDTDAAENANALRSTRLPFGGVDQAQSLRKESSWEVSCSPSALNTNSAQSANANHETAPLFSEEEFPALGGAKASSSKRRNLSGSSAPQRSQQKSSLSRSDAISIVPTEEIGNSEKNFPVRGGANASASKGSGLPGCSAPQMSQQESPLSKNDGHPIVQTEETGGSESSFSKSDAIPIAQTEETGGSESSFSKSDAIPIVQTEETGNFEKNFPALCGTNGSSSKGSDLSGFSGPEMSQQESPWSKRPGLPIVQKGETGGSTVAFSPPKQKMPASTTWGGSRDLHYHADGRDGRQRPAGRGTRGESNNRNRRWQPSEEIAEVKKGSRDKFRSGEQQTFKEVGNKDRIYYLGRLLTSILRHRAAELGLKMRNDGYVIVDDLLKLGIQTQARLPLSVYTIADVRKVVEQDQKRRFGILTEDNVLLIRANQGHSIKDVESDKLLNPISSAREVSVCVHGTFLRHLDSILKNGLSRMERNHVHFASGLPNEDGVISGMRSYCEVLIYLDVEKALQDGMKLFTSENGVILTEGFDGIVPRKYFAQVVNWKNGKTIPI